MDIQWHFPKEYSLFQRNFIGFSRVIFRMDFPSRELRCAVFCPRARESNRGRGTFAPIGDVGRGDDGAGRHETRRHEDEDRLHAPSAEQERRRRRSLFEAPAALSSQAHVAYRLMFSGVRFCLLFDAVRCSCYKVIEPIGRRQGKRKSKEFQ